MLTFTPINLNWIPEQEGRSWTPVCQADIYPPYGTFGDKSQKMENYVTDVVREFWAKAIDFLPVKYMSAAFVNSLILQWGYRLVHNSIDAGLSTGRRSRVYKSLSFATPHGATQYAIDVFDWNGGFDEKALSFDFFSKDSYPSKKLWIDTLQEGGAGEALLLIHKAVALAGGEIQMGNYPLEGDPMGAFVRIILPETALQRIVFDSSFIPREYCD